MISHTISRSDVFNDNQLKAIVDRYGKGIILNSDNMVDFLEHYSNNAPKISRIRDAHHFMFKREDSSVRINSLYFIKHSVLNLHRKLIILNCWN